MKYTLTSILLLLFLQLNAQTHEDCGTDIKHERLMQRDPAYRAAFEQHERDMQAVLNNPRARTQSGTYKIPVVVHVLHLGSAVGVNENISDEQVYSAIDYMNKAYAHQAPYNQGTQGVAVGLEFCLAQKNPSGIATSGIDRVNMTTVNTEYMTAGMTDNNELTIKNATAWNRSKYYNIWIVSEIDDNGAGSGVQGYAYFPGAGSYDGAVILYNSFGYDPTGASGYNLKSYTNMNITATHEIGHALNLYHTFQGDGTGSTCPTNTDCTVDGDKVCDTPPHLRSTSNCNTSGTNSCTGTSNNFIIHNFMDYSSDVCQYEFTSGQSARMLAALQTAPSRTVLVSAANLTACGCDGDLPIIRFYADNTAPCPGTTVQFTDQTINFPTTWSWSFPGGTPSTSTAQNPSVTYSTAGSYNVTLTVNSGQNGGRTLTKTAYINSQVGQAPPISETFTSTTFVPLGWNLDNPDASKTWERYATDGSTNYAARVNNYSYNSSGQVDDLILPTLNLSGYETVTLTFKVAHKMFSGSFDTLRVLVSPNCDGSGGTMEYNKYGTSLQTTTTGSGSFVPASSADWRTETISLTGYIGQSVRIVFRNITDYGNNTYIDNINITTTTGTQTSITDAILYVYPNPANNTLYTAVDVNKFEKVQIINMQGTVMLEQEVSANNGTIDISGLSTGVYLARFSGDQYFDVRRFTIIR